MTGRMLAAQQPGYLPYVGFFHKVARCDVLVLQDDLQYVKQEHMNRNRIQADVGWRWLTVPVHTSTGATVAGTQIAGWSWMSRHRRICEHEYRAAPHRDRLEPLWDTLHQLGGAVRGTAEDASLAEVNIALIRWFLDVLDLHPVVVLESELGLPARLEPNERLIRLCRLLDCDAYLSGAGGQGYVQSERWHEAGIELRWQRFEAIPYPRGDAPWIPCLSMLDALAYAPDPSAVIA